MADDQGDKEIRALCKLFIGGIPRSISDEELAESFLQYTDDECLNDCVVIKDEMKNSRGFGFVTYNKLCDTDNCLAHRPHVLGGKEVEVKHAIPRDEQNPTNHSRTNKIFLGGFPREASEEDAREAIENYKLAAGENLNVKVEKVDIIKKGDEPRGFCFVEMASEDDADKVVIVKHFQIHGKRVELKKAEPKGAKSGMGGGMGGRGGGRGGRDSNRGGGGRMSSFGGGGAGWGGGNVGYGGGYDQYNTGSSYHDYSSLAAGYAGYAQAGGFGGGYDYSLGSYPQTSSSFGPSRTSNGRYGGGGGGSRGGRGGAGGGSGGYRPY